MKAMTQGDLDGRLTITVPEAGQVLGIGRDASYAAAERGEIPVLRLGRTLRVPVPLLLQLLGIPPNENEAGPLERTDFRDTTTTDMESSHAQQSGTTPARALRVAHRGLGS